jgi:hypothetical protein
VIESATKIYSEDSDEEDYPFGSYGFGSGRRFSICRANQEYERGGYSRLHNDEEKAQEAQKDYVQKDNEQEFLVKPNGLIYESFAGWPGAWANPLFFYDSL